METLSPSDAQELSQALRESAASGRSIALRGAGSKSAMGGTPADAESPVKRALAIIEATAGKDSPLMAEGLMVRGTVAQHAGRFQQAEADFTACLAMRQNRLGADHPDASATLDSLGVLAVSPFESVDTRGVGRLIRIAVEEGRAAHPGLRIGVCGEHGGDPLSIQFFHEVGLDYVSCSPFRVPIARLEAGRAKVASESGQVADTR